MLIYYFIGINILTFLLFLIDKFKAVNGLWRIKESTLLFFTIIGGSIGALLGMYLVKHKKNKSIFNIVTFFSLIGHLFLIYKYKI